MPDKCDNQKFVEITNKDVYQKLCDLEKNFNETIFGNGKKGILRELQAHCTQIKIQWGLLSVLVLTVIGTLIKGLF